MQETKKENLQKSISKRLAISRDLKVVRWTGQIDTNRCAMESIRLKGIIMKLSLYRVNNKYVESDANGYLFSQVGKDIIPRQNFKGS